MIVDVAHGSAALVDDILARATRPVLSSHTGVRGVCDNDRNLHDRHVDGIAKSGGLISITCVCLYVPLVLEWYSVMCKAIPCVLMIGMKRIGAIKNNPPPFGIASSATQFM